MAPPAPTNLKGGSLRVTYLSLLPGPLERSYRFMAPPAPTNLKGGSPRVAVVEGVVCLNDTLGDVPTLAEFSTAFERLCTIEKNGPVRTFSHTRQVLLKSAFEMHTAVHHRLEDGEQRKLRTDLYRVAKVDNHIHLAAGMPVRDFRAFMEEKALTEGDVEVVPGKTLSAVLKEANLEDPAEVFVDQLEVMGDYQTFTRFDKFNGKYAPFKSNELRSVFLKTDNHIQGRYFAELAHRAIDRLAADGSTFAEYRVSVYGLHAGEWEKLARWLLGDRAAAVRAAAGLPVEVADGAPPLPRHRCLLVDQVMWQVQIPRLWSEVGGRARPYRSGAPQPASGEGPPWAVAGGAAAGGPTFADAMANVFAPLFEATLHPGRHPELAAALARVGGFDSVDDESRAEAGFAACACRGAQAWPADRSNPHYAWQLYYLYANVRSLNALRGARGLNTFSLRPHAGECGSTDHLAAAYLTAQSINHGVELHNSVMPLNK